MTHSGGKRRSKGEKRVHELCCKEGEKKKEKRGEEEKLQKARKEKII